MAQTGKHLPTMRETWVQSLGQEDPLEKAMAAHSSTLAWKIPWTEESSRLQSTGSKRSDITERLHFTGIGLSYKEFTHIGSLEPHKNLEK